MKFKQTTETDFLTRFRGLHTAVNLAKHGAHVFVCVRSAAKGDATLKTIEALSPGAQISILEIEHTSLSSVTTAAKSFLSKEKALHGLVNNAGVMAVPFELTQDGYDIQWQ